MLLTPEQLMRRAQELLAIGERMGRDMNTPHYRILRAYVDGSPREELVDYLITYPHTWGRGQAYPGDGYIGGTWDTVTGDMLVGWISEDEYHTVRAAVNPQPPTEVPFDAE